MRTAVHVPSEQVSSAVQELPSSQGVPSGWTSPSHGPRLPTSLVVQGLPSSHEDPSATGAWTQPSSPADASFGSQRSVRHGSNRLHSSSDWQVKAHAARAPQTSAAVRTTSVATWRRVRIYRQRSVWCAPFWNAQVGAIWSAEKTASAHSPLV